MSNENIERRSKKKRKKRRNSKPLWLKITLVLLAILLLVAVLGIGMFYLTFNKMDKVDLSKSNLGITSTEELKGYDNYKKIKNIVLFGVDSEDGATSGRSDAIMVATIDSAHDKLKVTSIMRDSYVNIEDHGYDKINHAFAFGGPELSIKTINQTFGLNIEDFVAVDFSSLPIIIDELGGLELNITEEEINCEININSYINDLNAKEGTNSDNITTPGPQFVDGVQALAYSRIRYTAGGDYERTQRQRTVLNAIFEKAKTIAPSQYLGLINSMLPHIQTNLGANEILSLATNVASIGGGNLQQDRFPRDGTCEGQNIDGVFYLVFDEATTKQQMMDYIFDDK